MRKPTNESFRYILFFIVVVVAGIGIYGYFRADDLEAPRVKVDPPNYDFGRIDPEPVSKKFELSNTGNSMLKIKGIATSCSCTTAKVTKKAIVSDKSATLTVTFDPTTMDPPVRGEVMRIIYIETNDPNQEETKIKIKATVSGGEQVDEK